MSRGHGNSATPGRATKAASWGKFTGNSGPRVEAVAPEKSRRVAKAAPVPVEWNEVRHVNVDANSDGQRIDNFLMKHLPGVPKSAVYRLVRSGQVRVDGGRAKPERKLTAGESVRIPPVRLAEPGAPQRIPDRLLNELRECIAWQDDHYLVINKPAGISAHSGSGVPFGVIEACRAWNQYDYLELCHRLDRDTSGVLLLAKTRNALLRAQRAFKNGEAEKRYFALVTGKWKGEDRDVDAALVKSRLASGERYIEVDEEDGKPAHSRFSPKAKYRDCALMEVQIFSGRTHQIRVHALALGHPIAGDEKYGEREVNGPLRKRGLKRMFLHSHFLGLPATESFPRLLLDAPLPSELRSFIDVVERAERRA